MTSIKEAPVPSAFDGYYPDNYDDGDQSGTHAGKQPAMVNCEVCQSEGRILTSDGGGRYIADWQTRIARFKAAEARLAEAKKVIGFYADQRRYDGPNLRPIPDDPFAKPDAVYIHDVTRDHGEIARSFLNSASKKEPR